MNNLQIIIRTLRIRSLPNSVHSVISVENSGRPCLRPREPGGNLFFPTRSALLRKAVVLGCAILAIVATSVEAHHSPAIYDVAVTDFAIEGEIQQVEFRNPHSEMLLVVKPADGPTQEWEIEFSSVNLLLRRGWKLDRLNVGDHVTCIGNPGKNGALKMYMWSVKLADDVVFERK